MSGCDKNEWFRSWFNSPYYHLLYHKRDDCEARGFLEKLLQRLELPVNCKILDLACGKGRHSIFLNSKGFDVTGIDLSGESIASASQSESNTLHFGVHDMRTFDLQQKFGCIMNLFTSFGYFQENEENRQVLSRVKQHLLHDGYFILDYFNSEIVKAKLHPEHVVTCQGVSFHIRKHIENNQVIKTISFEDEGHDYCFEERVQLLAPSEISRMIAEIGLVPVSTYGDYHLNEFNPETSDRFIIIARN